MDNTGILGTIAVTDSNGSERINLPASDIIASTGRSMEQLNQAVAMLENVNNLPAEYREIINTMRTEMTDLGATLTTLKGLLAETQGQVIPIGLGGTGATTAAAARTALAVEPQRTTMTQAEAEAGTATTVRGVTPQRMNQAATAAANRVLDQRLPSTLSFTRL